MTVSAGQELLAKALEAIERLEARLAASERSRCEPIAIVGAGCRFPGGVESPDQLWTLVRDGVDAVSDVPRDRWDLDAYYDPDPKAPGKMVTRRGGFLARLDEFDPQHFGISPREAQTMDPQQRLLLETAYEALESAGLAPDQLVGSNSGVFVGITTSDYAQLLRANGNDNSDVYSATGGALNAAAGRIAYVFGLQGPCLALDTACSSSLVAVHLACQSLRSRESDLALAGGVNVILSPDAMVLFSRWGMMAPDGACKTFDAAADGFVRSEGCAMIALRRLSDALASRDRILAVIRGSAVNSDGRSSGLTVPNGPAQQAVIRKALADADLRPEDIDYVEAHGTGTSLGDPIEVEALGAVLGEGHTRQRPLRIGSIKTNIGHTEAASGLAGLLKAVMALHHGVIPPHLHFARPNPGIPWQTLPIEVPTRPVPWPRGPRVRRAGVSSFGFSGTNAHLVLEEAPVEIRTAGESNPPFLYVVSGRTDLALRAVAERHAECVSSSHAALADLAATAASGRAHLARRAAIVADSKAELARDLRTVAAGNVPSAAFEGAVRPGERLRVGFLFSGQGSQYAGMGRRLYETEAVFKGKLDRAAEVLAPLLDRPLLDVLFEANAPLAQTAYTQPALYALQVALAELWRSWGILPTVVLGHSVGEFAAACVAGVFSFEDGLLLVAERGRLMGALPREGAMAALFASVEDVTRHLVSYGDRLSVAAINGPEETVISGDAAAVRAVLAAYTDTGIGGRLLEVSHAFHSSQMDPMLDAFERRATVVAHSAPRAALVSNLTGQALTGGARPDGAYWRRHAREPVRFAAGLEAIRDSGVTALLEIGPHPTLLSLAHRALPDATWTTVSSMRRGGDDRREMLRAAGALYASGATLNWPGIVSPEARRAALPTYPFQREHHWIRGRSPAIECVPRGHPLLGVRLELASAPGTHVWQTEMNLERQAWLRDHRVQGAAIVPATAYIEMCLAAAAEVLGQGSLSITGLQNVKPIILREGESCTVQATLVVGEASAEFKVLGRPTQEGTWTTRATASIRRAQPPAGPQTSIVAAARERSQHTLSGPAFYAELATQGNQWGPCFQGAAQLWIGDDEVVARIELPAAVTGEASSYLFHPAIADACGHALVAAVPRDRGRGAFVGGSVEETLFHRSPGVGPLWAVAQVRPGRGREVVGDVRVYDANGVVISETLGACLVYLDAATDDAVLATRDWFYEVRWHGVGKGEAGSRAAASGTWLLLGDAGGLAQSIVSYRERSGFRTVQAIWGNTWSVSGDRATLRAEAPDDYRRLIEAIGGPTVIVQFGSEGKNPSSSAVALLQGVLASKRRQPPRLWFVTADAQSVISGDACEGLWDAALWGLGRALSAEHPQLWGGLIDVTRQLPVADAARAILQEIELGSPEDKVAFRRGGRYVPRLARRTPATHADPVIHSSSSYLVTGGLGGIGLAIAHWLVKAGARHLLLIGRTPRAGLGPPALAALAELESLGARVETASLDVAADAALERCLASRRARGEPPVRGAIHAAGTLAFKDLASLDGTALEQALAAKIGGGWRLHQALLGEPVEFFVLCSSSSALLNSPLLGAYAAGNAFLDTLAHYRNARGLPASAINWGTWSEVGMAMSAHRSRMLTGMGTISTSAGLAAFGLLVAAKAIQVAVMPVDWNELARAYPAFAADPLLADLVPADSGETRPVTPLAALRDAPAAMRAEVFRTHLHEEVARILGMAPSALETAAPLSSLGFDSLMALQLKNYIETNLGAALSMVQLLQGPSIDEVVKSVAEALTAGKVSDQRIPQLWEEGSL